MNKMTTGNWAQSALEIAKHSTFTFSLDGWPAAAALMSLPAAYVLVRAINAFTTNT